VLAPAFVTSTSCRWSELRDDRTLMGFGAHSITFFALGSSVRPLALALGPSARPHRPMRRAVKWLHSELAPPRASSTSASRVRVPHRRCNPSDARHTTRHAMVSTPVVVTLYRALSRSLRRLQPQISRHGRSPATLFTEVGPSPLSLPSRRPSERPNPNVWEGG
jgi:hypothetical protein